MLSKVSLDRLATVHSDLQRLFKEVDKLDILPFMVVEGIRTLETQKKYLAEGKTKTLNSRHLTGHAVDIALLKDGKPDWTDTRAYNVFAGIVMAVAKQQKIPLRWGGNFNGNNNFADDNFLDLVHFELPAKDYP